MGLRARRIVWAQRAAQRAAQRMGAVAFAVCAGIGAGLAVRSTLRPFSYAPPVWGVVLVVLAVLVSVGALAVELIRIAGSR